MRSMHTKTSLS